MWPQSQERQSEGEREKEREGESEKEREREREREGVGGNTASVPDAHSHRFSVKPTISRITSLKCSIFIRATGKMIV